MAKKKTFGFDDIFGEPKQTVKAPKPSAEPKEQPQPRSTHYTSKKTGQTYGKHNFAFSDALFDKLKALQRITGMPQHELLDTIIRRYIAEYEKKFGEINTQKPNLL